MAKPAGAINGFNAIGIPLSITIAIMDTDANRKGPAMNKACLKLIGEQLAAETMARAALIRAQHSLRGKRLSYVDSLNAALDAMMRET